MPREIEKEYRALNAHVENTILRVKLDEHTGALEFWVGKAKGRDYPRRAKISPADVADFKSWINRL